MIQGARRVGKSTIVERFVKNEYDSYILIDLIRTDDKIRRIFMECRFNTDMFFNRMQQNTGVKLHERKSAIVFDNVQAFPLVWEMIKILVKDGRYDYIGTGSLISVKSKTADIRIPSEEHRIDMHPMDFEEWLWANGDEVTMDLLRGLLKRREPLGEGSHRAVLRRYTEYLVVGGMPQVVSAYLEHHDLMEAELAKREILDLYREDIRKIPGVSMERVLNLFDGIPAILSSPHKVLSATKIKRGTRRREYDGAIGWLCDAKMFNRCRCSSEPGVAMESNENVRRTKCYFLDTGLLISLSFQNDEKGLAETYGLLLDGKLSVNKGMMFENMVAQELTCRGYDLWFTEFDRENSNRKYEVDFILPGRNGMVPIEVKSGKSTPHPSLDRMIEKYDDRIEKTFVIHSKDLKEDDGILYVPIYMMQAMSWN